MDKIKLSNLKEDELIEQADNNESARTVEFWKRHFTGIEKKIFEMVIFEKGLEERDRLTKSQLDFFMERRKNKKIG